MTVASRQIAIATVIEACKRRQLLSQHQARYPIYVIGHQYWIGVDHFEGVAVLTPDALFLLKRERTDRVTKLCAEDLAFASTPLLEMNHGDIPSILTEEEAWPQPPKYNCEVAVLMRDQLRAVEIADAGEVVFRSAATPVRVLITEGDGNVALRHLQGTGWMKDAPPAAALAPASPLHSPARPGTGSDYRPLAVGLICAAVVGVIILITRLDVISPTLALMLCVPLLAVAVMVVLWLLAPSVPPAEDAE